jgi:hypothetical protein
MRIEEEGPRLTITSEPMLVAKVFALGFVVLTALMWFVLVLSMVRPPRQASIDCARDRGTCELTLSAAHRTAPLGDIEGAHVVYRRGSRNRSASHHIEVRMRSGAVYPLSEEAFDDAVVAGFRRAASGLNEFLDTPAQPTFSATYTASSTDWVPLGFFAVICPLMAALFMRMWVVRRIEVDRQARSLRVTMKPRLGSDTRVDLPFSDVTNIRATGTSKAFLGLATRDAYVPLFVIPRAAMSQTRMKEILDKLTGAIGAPLDASGPFRTMWGVQ